MKLKELRDLVAGMSTAEERLHNGQKALFQTKTPLSEDGKDGLVVEWLHMGEDTVNMFIDGGGRPLTSLSLPEALALYRFLHETFGEDEPVSERREPTG